MIKRIHTDATRSRRRQIAVAARETLFGAGLAALAYILSTLILAL
jgi:hypothetical protein